MRLLECLVLLIGFGWSVQLQAAEPAAVREIIEGEIAAALKASQTKPALRAADATLLRRLYLDLLGRIPTADEARTYLTDESPDRQVRLIETLLAHEEFPAYWSLVLDGWLNASVLERDFGRDGFLEYLRQSLAANKPWNELARELLASDPSQQTERAAAYFLAVRLRAGDNAEKLDSLTSAVATGLFGLQLQCAKCHDHPLVEEIKQDHYYGLAAFLARTQEARFKDTPIVKERADGEATFVTTAREQKTARLMFLDGHVIDEPASPADRNAWYAKGTDGLPDSPYFSRRAALANYAITAQSPYFKRAIVNRIWKQLLGRGLVEPVDQMHAANPASHPQLLDKLAEDFAGHGFDLRRLISGIVHSEAYLRSSQLAADLQRPRDSEYALAILKPLSPDQLAASIGVATGHYAQQRSKLKPDAGAQAVDAGQARLHYARQRDVQDFAARFRSSGDAFEAHASQALFLSYHALLAKQLQPSQANLVERLIKQSDNAQAATEAWLGVLSRMPAEDELAEAVAFLSSAKPSRQTLCRELVWSLICSAEFRFNY